MTLNYNERDIEGPALIDFIKSHPDIKSILDVGSHWSWSYYAPEVRKLVKHYAGIDILEDPQTAAILDRYIVGNVLDKKLTPYDLVCCISSIEHSGISTYKVEDYQTEQLRVFKRLLKLSKKYLFVTFPFGQEALHEGQFANITKELLRNFTNEAILHYKLQSITKQFYFSGSPQEKVPYQEVSMDFASQVEYKPELGTRCFCILTIEKV